ncbi:septation ring formation regulator EzrA [Priestia flexa]|uniref:septation ring formation regulator EzrA n=1 Tax=Priestia TaxID=2800373 RepID=UPI00077CCECB|nr:septation ring formation regulator EzrA [Priestia flexa]MBY6085427.1 septation ring formation regulator EzrA [Priestia flexa]MCG7311564.1 septation ring formation regulator EzrA [Priestia flexa]MCP1190922.1 septation ring formation regulator EzrA [Priestia flexa]MED4590422.1 septation ring formation regulator EzrA [Priestia flexa]SIR51744.1 septation ring formation regulator [Priestia flexa]
MEFIIALIILIIGLVVYGMFSRKKIYQEIDRLESRKMELENMPVAEEISKVKELNMTGQTEELFERWREQWDEIVATELPKVDELLFETEECADKYRFKKAKQLSIHINELLDKTKAEIENILTELQNLIGSEQNNRHDIEELNQLHRHVKKKLLAHRYSYGKAEKTLEAAIDHAKKQFAVFEEETANGNYLQARETVLQLKTDLTTIDTCLEQIPKVLVECQTTLPAQFSELIDGFMGMTRDGYVLDHLQVEETIEFLRHETDTIIQQIEELYVEEAMAKLDDVNERLEQLYDALEHEVYSYHKMNQESQTVSHFLKLLQDKNRELRDETLFVQQSYHFKEKDLELYYKMDRELKRLTNLYYNISDKVAEHNLAYSVIQEELEDVSKQLKQLQQSQESYSDMLQALRKDELTAKEQIEDLKSQLIEAKRLIQKSNLPGVPEYYKVQLEKTMHLLKDATLKLQEKPLNIQAVQALLSEAVEAVKETFEETEAILEEAQLVEKMIQYGNRYRSQYGSVAQALRDAEELFRKYEYKEALNEVASAIEQVDPGAVEKIQQFMITNR